MLEKFEAMQPEKRQRILDACTVEFASKGYVKANTNEMVKKAGISKGLLFHYFGSKKRLYLYIVEYSLKVVAEAIQESLGNVAGDVFERLTEISAAKMRMALEFPHQYAILLEAYLYTPDELKDDIIKEYAAVFEVQKEKFVAMMDKNRLRDDVTPERAYDLIYACAQGVLNPAVKKNETLALDEALEQIDQHRKEALDLMRLLKRAIYKE